MNNRYSRMRRTLRLMAAAAIVASVSSTPAFAQAAAASPTESPPASVPEMRTRLLNSLTGYEVSEYLKRNDTIFVPIHPPGTNLHATTTDLLGAVAVNTRSGCSEFALMHAADQLPTAITSRDVASVDVTTDTEESFRDVSACIAYRTLDGWQPGPDAATTTAPGAETAHLHFTLDAPGVDMLALGIRKSGATAVHEIAIELR